MWFSMEDQKKRNEVRKWDGERKESGVEKEMYMQ